MTYFQILLTVYLVFLISNKLLKITVYESITQTAIFSLAFLIIGILWDTYAVTNGHWLFGEKFLTGIYLGNLPLEEYLFFIVVPYGSISFYNAANKYIFHK